MSFTFNGAETKKIYIAFGEKESVCLAVNDFIGDVHKICGDAEITSNPQQADIFVCSQDCEEFSSIANGKAIFTHEEEFCYCIENGKIYFLGADDLGVMWAIYTFV